MDLEANHLQQQQHQQQHDLSRFPGHLVSANDAPALDTSGAASATAVANTASSIAATALLFDGTSLSITASSGGGILTASSTVCPPPSSPSSSIFSTAQHDIYRLPNIGVVEHVPTSLDNIAGKLPKSKLITYFKFIPALFVKTK